MRVAATATTATATTLHTATTTSTNTTTTTTATAPTSTSSTTTTLHYRHHHHHTTTTTTATATTTQQRYTTTTTTTTAAARLHYTTWQLQLHYATPNYIQQLWVRWPLQPIHKAQLQSSFGPSVDSLCHPCITTTHPSYTFLSLKLPPPPGAVLLPVDYNPL